MSRIASELLSWVHENDVQRFKNERQLNCAINVHFGGSPRGRKYPVGCYSGICDVAIPAQDGKFGWIEIKYAQTYFSQADFNRNNSGLFEKYVFSDSPNEHSVTNDLTRKLASLVGRPEVDYVGMLVVFLYSDRYPLPKDTFRRLDAIAVPKLWEKTTLPAWRNPDHKEIPSYVLPAYWQRTS